MRRVLGLLAASRSASSMAGANDAAKSNPPTTSTENATSAEPPTASRSPASAGPTPDSCRAATRQTEPQTLSGVAAGLGCTLLPEPLDTVTGSHVDGCAMTAGPM